MRESGFSHHQALVLGARAAGSSSRALSCPAPRPAIGLGALRTPESQRQPKPRWANWYLLPEQRRGVTAVLREELHHRLNRTGYGKPGTQRAEHQNHQPLREGRRDHGLMGPELLHRSHHHATDWRNEAGLLALSL